MARGDMFVQNAAFGGGAEILNRPPYEGVSMTIDFTDPSDGFDTDKETGENVVRAGMPIDKDGKPVHETPFTNAVGILLVDVYEHRPQGTILKKAYINKKRAEANADVTYDETIAEALPMIVIE